MKRVFITGATGFIGQALTKELLAHDYQVIGLARSQESVDTLKKIGAMAHLGSLQDTESVLSAVAKADAVIHTAFNHDFSTFQQNCEDDRHLILAIGRKLKGTSRPLIVTSGAFFTGKEKNAPHGIMPITSEQFPRAASDEAALKCDEEGIHCRLVGLPQVHDTRKFGLISPLIELAKEKSLSAYIGQGENQWAAVHLSDAVRAFRLALEKGKSGMKYMAVGEEDISFKAIAEAIGSRLNIATKSLTQEQAEAHFGWLTHFAQLTLNTSGAETKQALGWEPKGAPLMDDLANAILE